MSNNISVTQNHLFSSFKRDVEVMRDDPASVTLTVLHPRFMVRRVEKPLVASQPNQRIQVELVQVFPAIRLGFDPVEQDPAFAQLHQDQQDQGSADDPDQPRLELDRVHLC